MSFRTHSQRSRSNAAPPAASPAPPDRIDFLPTSAPSPTPARAAARARAPPPQARIATVAAPVSCGYGIDDVNIAPTRTAAMRPVSEDVGAYFEIDAARDPNSVVAVFADTEGDSSHWNSCVACIEDTLDNTRQNTVIFNGDFTDHFNETLSLHKKYKAFEQKLQRGNPKTELAHTIGNRDGNKARLMPGVELPSLELLLMKQLYSFLHSLDRRGLGFRLEDHG